MATVLIDANRTIPTRVRAAVVERDGMVCQRCASPVVRSATYRPDMLHLDHVIPWSEGGGHTLANLIVCCARCNLTRPRPTAVIRDRKIRVSYASGSYWWSNGYEPPFVFTNRRAGWALRTYERELGMPPLETLRLVVGGHLAATRLGSIRVEVPAFVKRSRDQRRELGVDGLPLHPLKVAR